MKNLKYLQRFFMLLFVGFSLCAVQACGDDEENEPIQEPNEEEVVKLNLIGVWEYSHSGGYDLYQFNNDGTGNGIDSDGYYWNFKYDLNAETLRLVYTKENESAEIWNIDIIANSSIQINKKMILTRTTEKLERYKAVDLGLSVKWATCNIGASRPEDYGNHYAWGETEEKSDYDWDTYKWCKGTYETLTKYCTNSECGMADSLTTLNSSDDVATLKWGSKWRMPTQKEMQELVEDCTWTWTTKNEVKGMKVTGPNGNSIFMPAAGYRDGTELYFFDLDSDGFYWSASLHWDSYSAYNLYFNRYNSSWYSLSDRGRGFAVRPVTN